MPPICLLIPDPALREAVSEQIAAAALGIAQEWPDAKDNAAIFIVDAAASAAKIAPLLQFAAAAPEKPVILMLGDAGDREGISESFVKPLRLGHLVTRLRYYLETAPLLRDRVIDFGPYRLEPQNRRILCAAQAEPVRLTEKETALLVYLARRDSPAARRDILADVWGYDERIDTHTLETHIYQLRRKLDPDGKNGSGENWLVSEAGAYRLAREPH